MRAMFRRCSTRLLYEPTVRAGLRAAAFARRLQSGNVRTYAGYLLGLVIGLLVLRLHGSSRMSVVAAIVQVAAIALAPLLPGSIQALKARLQGRRGPSPLQPYRTLWRLWRKSAVDPQGAGVIYRLAPPLVAACLLAALAIVPVAGRSGSFGLGNDALVLVGLLALARFVLAVASWDTGNGFALMASARELMISVFGEALLVLALLVAALPAHSTDLRGDERRCGGWAHLERAGALVRADRVCAGDPRGDGAPADR